MAVESCREKAARLGLAVEAIVADLEEYRLPVGRYDLIVNFYYLQRSLAGPIVRALKRGGVLVFESYTIDQLQYGYGPKDPTSCYAPASCGRCSLGWRRCSTTRASSRETAARRPWPSSSRANAPSWRNPDAASDYWAKAAACWRTSSTRLPSCPRQTLGLLGRPAAVHRQDDARDAAGLLGGQVEGGVGYVLRLSDTPQGVHSGQCLQDGVVGHRPHHGVSVVVGQMQFTRMLAGP